MSIIAIAKLNKLSVSAPSCHHSLPLPTQQPLGIPLWDGQKPWNYWAKEQLVYLSLPLKIIFILVLAIVKLNQLLVLIPSHHHSSLDDGQGSF